ncbi:MAG: cytochrome c biogenesis protein CcdA [Spirochaetia bacterium]|jgi:cytochrome c-type biogenesis protein
MVAQNVSILIAFAAGVVSFVSPCILPVIPSYLSFLGGVSFSDITAEKASRRAVFVRTIFFVAGFSLVFVALGLVFSSAGLLLKGVQTIIYRVAGALIIVFGLNFVFDFWRTLEIERRFHVSRRPRGAPGSMLLGIAFGAGWTPCVGPILSSILFLAGTSDSLAHGTILLASYSVGLGTPFVLAGAFANRFLGYSRWLRSHMRGIKIASGAFLVLLGLLIFLGSLARLNVAFFGLAAGLEAWQRADPLGPRLLFGSLFLGSGALVAAVYARRVAKSLREAGTSIRSIVRPIFLAAIGVFLAASILSFTGTLDFGSAISAWLRFQGV